MNPEPAVTNGAGTQNSRSLFDMLKVPLAAGAMLLGLSSCADTGLYLPGPQGGNSYRPNGTIPAVGIAREDARQRFLTREMSEARRYGDIGRQMELAEELALSKENERGLRYQNSNQRYRDQLGYRTQRELDMLPERLVNDVVRNLTNSFRNQIRRNTRFR